MATTVSGKLNKDAKEKLQSSGDMLFLVSIGKKEKDGQNNVDVWGNYQAGLFAKAGKQTDFYRDVLREGSVITLTASGLIPRIWGDNNDQVSMSMQNSRLEYAFNPNQSAPPVQQAYKAPAPQAPAQQQAPSNNFDDFDDFDDDIPF